MATSVPGDILLKSVNSCLKNYSLSDSDDLKGQNPFSSALVGGSAAGKSRGRGRPGRSHLATRRGDLAQALPLAAGWQGLSSAPCPGVWILGQDWEIRSAV